jgi:hypothetical protein
VALGGCRGETFNEQTGALNPFCGKEGAYFFYWKSYLCPDCRLRKPWVTLCRSKAIQQFGFTITELSNAYSGGIVRMFTTKNPYDPRNGSWCQPMRLVPLVDLEKLDSLKKRRDPATLEILNKVRPTNDNKWNNNNNDQKEDQESESGYDSTASNVSMSEVSGSESDFDLFAAPPARNQVRNQATQQRPQISARPVWNNFGR